jgi:glyoxylase-like metal-dependent hydrolase (beta-lactamase superfamily II)
MLSTRYCERMAKLGVTTNDVDYVLCTHLHVDHVGWNTRLHNGRWVPTFPNAQYVLSRTEYEAAKKDALNPTSQPLFRHLFEDSIHPIVEAGKACLVDGVHELLDQLTLRPAPGHSPGHFRIELRSQGAVGVFAGDICTHRSRFPCGNGARACAGTNAWRRLHGVSCLNSVRPRMHFCCPATSKHRT